MASRDCDFSWMAFSLLNRSVRGDSIASVIRVVPDHGSIRVDSNFGETSTAGTAVDPLSEMDSSDDDDDDVTFVVCVACDSKLSQETRWWRDLEADEDRLEETADPLSSSSSGAEMLTSTSTLRLTLKLSSLCSDLAWLSAALTLAL